MPTAQQHPARQPHRWVVAALAIAAGLTLPACSSSKATTTASESPAKVEAIAGEQVKKVTLTQRAAERLNIKTVQVTDAAGGQAQPADQAQAAEQAAGQPRKVLPYSAVLYGVEGSTWVYTMPSRLAYVRQRVVVADIKADKAVLTEGPATGTAVVTEGAALLYGTELGVK